MSIVVLKLPDVKQKREERPRRATCNHWAWMVVSLTGPHWWSCTVSSGSRCITSTLVYSR